MPTATATDRAPSNHLTLSDGTTTYGFVLCDRRGKMDPTAIQRSPVPRTSLKMTQGNTRYADLEFPYITIAQDNWAGGRGLDNFDLDHTRFADSYRLISRHENVLMLGPQETYGTGYRNLNQYLPGDVTWQSLTGSTRYVAYKFTTTAAYTAAKIYVWVRRRGSPGTLTCELRSDSPGDPGTVLQTSTATTSNITDTVSRLYMFDISNQSLSNATAYWVVIYGAGTDDATNYWQVGTDAADTNNLTEISTAGSTWSDATFDLYFRVVDNSTDYGAIFFEFKRQFYCVMNATGDGAARLYINGNRGVATGTGQSTTQLVDTTQSFTTNALVGQVLRISDGSGDIGKYYGTVTSNTGTAIVIDALTIAPSADDTEYELVAGNVWTEITSTGLGAIVTDVEVFGDFVYFAQGKNTLIRYMKEERSGDAWVRSFGNLNTTAQFLKVVHDPQHGDRIWAAIERDSQGRRSISSARSDNGILYFALTVEDCEDAWTAGTNVTVTADETDHIAGAASVKMVVAAGATAGQILAYEDLGASSTISFYAYTQVEWWAKSSVAVTEGDLQLRLSIAADASTSVQDFDFPNMVANTWTRCSRPIVMAAGYRNIRSVGVEMVTDLGAFDLFIDGIMTSPGNQFGSYIPLPEEFGRFTGLEAYGDPEALWVFREGQTGSVVNGVFTPLPLREMSNAQSRTTGAASTVNGVYLYFSFLQGLERYYRNNLDDMGPDRDEGLPDDRRGPITSLASYPGRIFASIGVEGGRYSSILEYNKMGWHEIYRASEANQSIDTIHIQVVPGWSMDRLWFVQGQDLLWIPLPGNTLREDTETNFRYTHEGTLESGWIYGNMQDLEKFYNSLKLITLDTAASAQVIEADYRTNETAAWSVIPGTFDAFREELEFTSASPPTVTGRRLRYRLRLQSSDNAKTPKVKAIILEAAARIPVKYSYTWSFVSGDDQQNIEQTVENYSRIETLVTQLDTWANSATVLTMRTVFSPYDNKEVLLDPASLRPLHLLIDGQLEGHIGQLSVIEI